MAREACERFGWRDGMGRLKEMACRKELARLERSGTVVLPAARPVSWQAREGAVPPAVKFCGELCDLEGVELRVVVGGTGAARGIGHAAPATRGRSEYARMPAPRRGKRAEPAADRADRR